MMERSKGVVAIMTKALRNIIRGMGSVVNIAPAPRHSQIDSPTRGRSDADAVRSDWQRVGDDIRASAERVRTETATHGQSQRSPS